MEELLNVFEARVLASAKRYGIEICVLYCDDNVDEAEAFVALAGALDLIDSSGFEVLSDPPSDIQIAHFCNWARRFFGDSDIECAHVAYKYYN
jgi:hypothetical protein